LRPQLGQKVVRLSSPVRRLRKVRIDVTVAWADREQDVRVAAPSDASLSVVLPALAGVIGAPEDAPMWLGTDLLPPDNSARGSTATDRRAAPVR